MDELQNTLNALMQDPAEMEKLMQTASALLGGDTSQPQEETSPLDGLNIPAILSKLQNSQSSNSVRLLEAMKPYLSESRRSKLDRAARIAKLASFAELAMGDGGGE